MAENKSNSVKNQSNRRGGQGRPGGQRRGRDRRGPKRRYERPNPLDVWKPLTQLGKMVKEGQITSIDEILKNNYSIKEKEIVDSLIPNMKDEVIDISMVQKQTDAGEQSRFQCAVVVGNGDGFVGLEISKNKEVGPGIRKAISRAKLSIIPVKRGCGSWECNCGGNHSIPFETTGKMGSVRVTLKPAPKGTGLACSDTAKLVLKLAGITDIWTITKGNTKNRANMAKAVFNALENMYNMMSKDDWNS
ncbi:MAG: 30S ribosomal protein S5 [Promethearchaeota archaeon]